MKRYGTILESTYFAAQYQQRPAPLGGGIVKLEWFRNYGPHEIPDKFDEIVQSWDSFLWAWLEQSSRPSQIEQVLQSAEAALARRSKGEWKRSSSTQLLRYRESHFPTVE